MNMELRMIGTGLLAAGLLAGTVLAEGQGKAGKEKACPAKLEMREAKEGARGSAERQEFQQQQRERAKAFWEGQRGEWQAIMQSVKNEEDPYKALAILRTSRASQRDKHVAFHESQWDKQMQFTASMLDKDGVGQERREKVLGKMVAAHAERKAEADARFAKMMKVLDDLAAKENLTKEDIRAAMRENMEQKREHKDKVGMEQKRERKKDKVGMEQKRERKKDKVGMEQKRERKKDKEDVEQKPEVKAAPDA